MRLLKSKSFAIAMLCCSGWLIYSNTFNSPFHFDDYLSIAANLHIRDVLNLKKIWDFWPTRFFTYYSLALNYHYGGLNVVGYHIWNLIVHLVSGILAWWLTRMTFSTPQLKINGGAKHSEILGLFAGLLFIAHPVQTQAVTYIIQRTTSLAAMFYLAALSLYVKARILAFGKDGSLARKFFYSAALLANILAMLTKEMAITLPFTILLYEFYFLKQGKHIHWKVISPFLSALLIIPFTMLATNSVNFLEMRRIIEPVSKISSWHYLLTQFRVVTTYLRLAFIPLHQNLDYDYAVSKTLLEFKTLISLLFLIALFIVALRAFRRYRLVSFGIFWFFLTLLPESGIIPIKDVIFEHRLYLPLYGFILFLVSIFFYSWGNKSVRSMLILLIIITGVYAALAYKRNIIWQNGVSLWDDTISKSPRKARPYNERGFIHLLKGDYDRAVSDFTLALKIDPSYINAYHNRGITYIKKEDYPSALIDFTQAISINVESGSTYANRAVAYFYNHEYEKAVLDVKKATALKAAVDPYFLKDLNKAIGSAK